MPTTPYARLLVSIDGGAPQSGGIEDVPPEASCQLSYESTVGWPSSPPPYVEIFAYPEGWSPGAPWLEEEVEQPNGAAATVFRHYGKVPPPAFTLPDVDHWDKVLFALVVANGQKGGKASADMVDESTGISVYSASGMRGIAYREGQQFGGHEKWLRDLKHNLRLINSGVAGGGATTQAPYVLAGPDPSGLLTSAVNLAALAGTLTIACASAAPIALHREVAAANSVIDFFSLRRTTSDAGHGQAGIGGRSSVELEDAAGNIDVAARHEWSYLTATSGSEVARHLIRLQVNGSLVDVLDLRGATIRIPGLAGSGAGHVAVTNDGDLVFSAALHEPLLVDASSTALANGRPLRALAATIPVEGAAAVVPWSFAHKAATGSVGTALQLRRTLTSGVGTTGTGAAVEWYLPKGDGTETVAAADRVECTAAIGSETFAAKRVFSVGGSDRLTIGSNGALKCHHYTTGIAHFDADGDVSSGLIVDADVHAAAAIQCTKLDGDFGSIVVLSDGGFEPSTSGQPLILGSTAGAVDIGQTGVSTVTIHGNLVVAGTTITANSTTIDLADRVIHVNASALGGGAVPVPAQIAGVAIDRGTADGTTKRDMPVLAWQESSSRFLFAYNTAGDDQTVGAALPLAAGSIGALSAAAFKVGDSSVTTSVETDSTTGTVTLRAGGVTIGSIDVSGGYLRFRNASGGSTATGLYFAPVAGIFQCDSIGSIGLGSSGGQLVVNVVDRGEFYDSGTKMLTHYWRNADACGLEYGASATSIVDRQLQRTGTGANAGAERGFKAQKGQNVSGGTNNDGGLAFIDSGDVGEGGTGGRAGHTELRVGGVAKVTCSGDGTNVTAAVTTFAPRFASKVSTPGSTGGALTIDLEASANPHHTTTEDTTVTIKGGTEGQWGTITFSQGATGRTVTMPANGSGVEYGNDIATLGVTAIVDTTSQTRTLLDYLVLPNGKAAITHRSVITIP